MKYVYASATLFLLFFASVHHTTAQVASYPFFMRDSTYYEQSGGTMLGDTASEDQYFVDTAIPLGDTARSGPGLPIGFTFTYNGFPFDVFGVSANGWIGLGNGSVNLNTSSPYFPLSSITGGNFLAPFARNLQAQDSASIEYSTIGTAPDRQLIVQWKNYRKHLNFNDHYNFQVHLYETSNRIEFVYGTVITNVNATFVSVGMTGTDNSDFNVRTTTTGGWAATEAGVLNSATCTLNPSELPTTGLVFRWEAPVPCTAPPDPGIARSSATSVCPNNPFIVSLDSNSTGPGQTYQWQTSPDSINWTDIPNATSTSFSSTQTAALLYRCTVTCSGIPAFSTPVFVDFNPPTLCYCNTNLGGDCGGYGYIDTLLIFNTTIANMHSGCAALTAPNYSDYPPGPGTTGTLLRGTGYQVSVTCTFEANISLWIDFDHSGTFDATEWTQVSAHALINVPSTALFAVPANALPGTTKMRLRTRINGAANGPTDACTNMLSGETEDYTIQIDYGVGINFSVPLGKICLVYPNPATSNLNIKWVQGLDNVKLNILDLDGKIVREVPIVKSSVNEISTVDLSGMTSGIYFVRLISDEGVYTEKIILNH